MSYSNNVQQLRENRFNSPQTKTLYSLSSGNRPSVVNRPGSTTTTTTNNVVYQNDRRGFEIPAGNLDKTLMLTSRGLRQCLKDYP